MTSETVYETFTDYRKTLANVVWNALQENFSLDYCLQRAIDWNRANNDFIKTEEVITIAKQVFTKACNQNKKDPFMDFLKSITVFNDGEGSAYAFINHKTVLIASETFEGYISYKYYTMYNKVLSKSTIKGYIQMLTGIAIHERNSHKLHNRVASLNNYYWYDLGDGDAVRFGGGNWSIEKSPILFKNYKHQQPQVKPISGGDPFEVLRYFNVDKKYQLLLMVYIITCFIADAKLPILVIYGPQGSGKSTLCKFLKKLIDPSSVEIGLMNADRSEIIQKINQHYLITFDNLSNLKGDISDLLASAQSGATFYKRKLHTDEDSIIQEIRRPIVINGINNVVTRPDLLSRAFLIKLDMFEPSQRVEDSNLEKDFNMKKALILGGIFDVLVKAVQIKPYVRHDVISRLDSIEKWGIAITRALGRRDDEFIEAFTTNLKRQNQNVISTNTLARAIINFMSDKTGWTGTMREAHTLLKQIANVSSYDTTFPKSENKLSYGLERIKQDLLVHKISYDINRHNSAGVLITFRKVIFSNKAEMT